MDVGGEGILEGFLEEVSLVWLISRCYMKARGWNTLGQALSVSQLQIPTALWQAWAWYLRGIY